MFYEDVETCTKKNYHICMYDSKEVKTNFGLTVKEYRTIKQLSQEQLAELVGLQQRTISRIENGKAFVSCEGITKFANVFNISPSTFFAPKVRIVTEEREKCIDEIKKLLPACDNKTLNNIRNILVVLQNNES